MNDNRKYNYNEMTILDIQNGKFKVFDCILDVLTNWKAVEPKPCYMSGTSQGGGWKQSCRTFTGALRLSALSPAGLTEADVKAIQSLVGNDRDAYFHPMVATDANRAILMGKSVEVAERNNIPYFKKEPTFNYYEKVAELYDQMISSHPNIETVLNRSTLEDQLNLLNLISQSEARARNLQIPLTDLFKRIDSRNPNRDNLPSRFNEVMQSFQSPQQTQQTQQTQQESKAPVKKQQDQNAFTKPTEQQMKTDNLVTDEQNAIIHLNTAPGTITLVPAVAGSGKTFTSIKYIEQKLKEGIDPKDITIMTFSNAAANDFKRKLFKEMPSLKSQGIHVSTSHSAANRIVKKYAPDIFKGRSLINSKNEEDKIWGDHGLMREALVHNKILKSDEYVTLNLKEQLPEILELTRLGTTLENTGINTFNGHEFMDADERKESWESIVGTKHLEFDLKTVEQIYTIYQDVKKENGYYDYADMMECAAHILQTNEKAKQEINKECTELIVDEYQDDTCLSQLLESYMQSPIGHGLRLGQSQQALYGGMGSNQKAFEKLRKMYPEGQVQEMTLTTGFRFDNKAIPATANALDDKFTENREDIHFIKCRPEVENSNATDMEPCLYHHTNETAEAKHIIEKIKKFIMMNPENDDIAILCRENKQKTIFEKLIMADDILKKHIDTKEEIAILTDRNKASVVKNFLNTFVAVGENEETQDGGKAAVSTVMRGFNALFSAIGLTQEAETDEWKNRIENIKAEAAARMPSELDEMGNPISSEVFLPVKDYINILKEIHKAHEPSSNWKVQDFLNAWDKAEEHRSSNSAYEVASVFLSNLEQYKEGHNNLYSKDNEKYLNFIDDDHNIIRIDKENYEADISEAIGAEKEKKRKGINICTIHASKGLEYDIVFVPNQNENNLMKHQKQMTTDEARKQNFNVEKCILYVALTRARKRLFVSYSDLNMNGEDTDGKSDLISEISDKFKQMNVDPQTLLESNAPEAGETHFNISNLDEARKNWAKTKDNPSIAKAIFENCKSKKGNADSNKQTVGTKKTNSKAPKGPDSPIR